MNAHDKLFETINNKTLNKILFVLLIVFDFYFMYIQWGKYPPRNYFTAFISILAFFELFQLGWTSFLNRYKISILITAFPIFYAVLSGLFSPEYHFNLKNFLRLSTLAFSMQYLCPKVEKDFIVKTVLSVVGISLFVAFLQLVVPEIGWGIRKAMDLKTFLLLGHIKRPAGLAYFTLTLSEQALIAFPLFLVFLDKRKINKYLKPLLIIIPIILFVFINSRGLILGSIICFIVMKYKKLLKHWKIYTTVGVALTLILYFYSRTFQFEIGNDGLRIDVLRVCYVLIRDNFFLGIGTEALQLKEAIIEASSQISNLLLPNAIGWITPHNYLINMQIEYGIVGLLLNIYLLALLARQRITIALFIGVLFNAQFHNGGIMNSTTIMIGYFIATSYILSPGLAQNSDVTEENEELDELEFQH
jgi:hypothetical protein